MTVHGRAAHAGVEPEKGRSAILEAARIIARPARPQRPLAGRDRQRRRDRRRHAAERRRRAVRRSRSTSGPTTRDGLEEAEAAIRRDRCGDRRCRTSTSSVERWPRWLADGEARAVAGGSSSTPSALAGAARVRGRGTRRPAVRRMRTRRPGMGVRRSTGSGPIGGNDHSPAEYLEVDSIVPRTTLLAGAARWRSRATRVVAWRERPDAASTPGAGDAPASADLVAAGRGRRRPATAGRSSSAIRAGSPARPMPGRTAVAPPG